MDSARDLQPTLSSRRSAPVAAVYASPPSASTCTSATPACSTSGRSASWPSAATASPSRVSHLGAALLGRASWSASPPPVVLALLLGVPTLRLRADYLAIVTIAAAEIIRLVYRVGARSGSLRRPGRPAGLHQRLHAASNPFTGRRYGIPGWSPGGPRPVDLLVGWMLVALCCLIVWLLMRSPWGRVLKAHPRGRGRGPQPRQERLRLQDAGADDRRRLRRPGRRHARGHQPDRSPRPVPDREPRSACTAILLLGGAGRSSARCWDRSSCWFLLSVTDSVLRQLDRRRRDHLHRQSEIGGAAASSWWVSALMLLMIFRPQGIFGDRRGDADPNDQS